MVFFVLLNFMPYIQAIVNPKEIVAKFSIPEFVSVYNIADTCFRQSLLQFIAYFHTELPA